MAEKRKTPRRETARRTGRDRRAEDAAVAKDKRKAARRKKARRDEGDRRD